MRTYFATTGKGISTYLLRQLREQTNATIITVSEGKILFDAQDMEQLFQLTCAERIFLSLYWRDVENIWLSRSMISQLLDEVESDLERKANQAEVTCERWKRCCELVAAPMFCPKFKVRVFLRTRGRWRKHAQYVKTRLSRVAIPFQLTVHLNDQRMVVGIQLPFYCPKNEGNLRRTVSAAMILEAGINPYKNYLLLDPCAGSGTISTTLSNYTNVLMICLDRSCPSNAHVEHFVLGDWCSTKDGFPFRSDVFDGVITDPPLNHRWATSSDELKMLVKACHRVLKDGAQCTMLSTKEFIPCLPDISQSETPKLTDIRMGSMSLLIAAWKKRSQLPANGRKRRGNCFVNGDTETDSDVSANLAN